MSAQEPLPPLTPELYGDGPAREAHITVVLRWSDCVNLAPDHPDHVLEFYHRQMNEEACVMENAAASLVDFPDAPWELRMFLARQCSDEARHVQVYQRLVVEHGGSVGQFPVLDFQYRVLRKIPSLIGRLAVQNRTFEADGLDAVTYAEQAARDQGDTSMAQIYDSQQADEILHVGFANEFLRTELKRDSKQALQVASALTHGARAFQEVFAGGGTDVSHYGVAASERIEAGFGAGEVEIANQQTEERRAEVRRRRGEPQVTSS